MAANNVYSLENISKTFQTGETSLNIFQNINLQIKAGETLAIVGASGSGKSTLLHIMGALDQPSSGKILFENKDLALFTPAEQAAFRNHSLGFVFQFHHLLPEFSTLENVAMPGFIGREKETVIMPQAASLLEQVGLTHRKDSKPATLSGGERQRAAIARALLLKPKVLLADEPTGNLDEQTGRQVTDLLLNLNKDLGITLVIVTHNREIAARMDRVFELRGGELYEKNYA